MCRLFTILLMCCSVLHAAVGQEAAARAAEEAWAAQSSAVRPQALPFVSGSYMWHGRADENYVPFHQWNLRIAAGDAARSDWRVKVIPLDGHFKPQTTVQPEWKALPATEAGAAAEVVYKLNCTAVESYRVLIATAADEQLFWAMSPRELPELQQAGAKPAELQVSNVDFRYDKRRRKAEVTCYLANIGDEDAEEVQMTLRFVNEAGAVVKEHVFVPDEKNHKGRIPAAYGGDVRTVIKKVPAFYNVQVSLSKKERVVMEFVDDGGSADEELQVRELALVEGALSLQVSNNADAAIERLELTISLEDEQGQLLEEVVFIAEDLAAGETRALTKACKTQSFAGYSMGYAY